MFHSTVRLKKIKVTWITLCKLKISQPWFSKYLFFLMVHLKVSFLSLSLAPFFSYKLDVSENQKIVVKKKIWFLSKEISRYTKKGSKKKYHVINCNETFFNVYIQCLWHFHVLFLWSNIQNIKVKMIAVRKKIWFWFKKYLDGLKNAQHQTPL